MRGVNFIIVEERNLTRRGKKRGKERGKGRAKERRKETRKRSIQLSENGRIKYSRMQVFSEYSFLDIHRAISFSKACKSAVRSQIVAMRVIFFYELSYRLLLI